MVLAFKNSNKQKWRFSMVTLNILLVLLGFINSLNKTPKNVEINNPDVGAVVLSGGRYC